jgi:NAD(P)-dependent dehydrogenase (short-subunit alcohol dehydrogenase family)
MASISRLTDKVAVVTGAARGIGLACAQRLAAEGAAVVLADREEKAGAAAAASIAGAEFVGGDVSRKADVEAIVSRVLDRHGRVDVLVNNAGITHACDFLDLEEAGFRSRAGGEPEVDVPLRAGGRARDGEAWRARGRSSTCRRPTRSSRYRTRCRTSYRRGASTN